MENFCKKNNHLEKGNWSIYYRLTNSDGMEIIDVKYRNIQVIKSAKIVDWHVNYSFKDGFGYSDAIGCPMFSSSTVIPFNGPKVEPIIRNNKEIGFTFLQDFRSPTWPQPCNYRHENRFELYIDGSFRIKATNLGRGCGLGGINRPIFRIDLTSNPTTGEKFEQWTGKQWNTENWTSQDKTTKYDHDNNMFKIQTTENEGYYLEPSKGQFPDRRKRRSCMDICTCT